MGWEEEVRNCGICEKTYDPMTSVGVGTWLAKYCTECIDKAVTELLERQDAAREARTDAALASYNKHYHGDKK